MSNGVSCLCVRITLSVDGDIVYRASRQPTTDRRSSHDQRGVAIKIRNTTSHHAVFPVMAAIWLKSDTSRATTMTSTADATQSTEITRDGKTVRIDVYPDGEGRWVLEIVDQDWNSTAWDQTFATAEEAMRVGVEAVEREGIGAFIGPKDAPSVH